jgi:rod shape-determining protein MreC
MGPGRPAAPLELRFMAGNADVQAGDVLTTSGVDGIYPAGLPVATIVKVERRADSPFARIICAPTALMAGSRHVLVLKPVVPPAPLPDVPATPAGKGARK